MPLRYAIIGGVNVPWHDIIQPYVKSTQLFKCPSNTATGNMNNSGVVAGYPAIPESYLCVGGNNAWGGTVPMSSAATSLSQQATPATTIMVGEHTDRQDSSFWADDAGGFNFQNHLGTTNFLFCDGHVKALKPTATMNPNMWTIEDDGDTLPQSYKDKIAARQAAMN